MNYDKLSIGELKEVIARAEHAIVEKRDRDIKLLRTEIAEMIKSRGFEINEIFPGVTMTKIKSKIAPVYRDPNNHENTWGGRGRKPKWVVALIESGYNLEDARI